MAPQLTAALDGGEKPSSRPLRFTPPETAPALHCVVIWVGLRARMNEHSAAEEIYRAY
jgi:hypothetical protein